MRFFSLLRGALLGGTLLTTAVPAAAQLFDRRQLHTAYQFGLLRTEQSVPDAGAPGGVIVTRKRPFMLGFVGGYSAPLGRFSDDHSVGLSLNVATAFAYVPDFELESKNVTPIFISLPEYVTWRYGAGATMSTKSVYGIGAGLGYRWGFVMVPGFHSPAAMIEFVFNDGDSDSFLRLSTDLNTHTHASAFPPGKQTRLRVIDLMLGARL
jgi:hypothetical protein